MQLREAGINRIPASRRTRYNTPVVQGSKVNDTQEQSRPDPGVAAPRNGGLSRRRRLPAGAQDGGEAEKGEAVAVRRRKNMANLLKPPEEAKKAITARILAGKDLTAKADIAERTGGYEDWLVIFAKWRDETIFAKWRDETAAELSRQGFSGWSV